MQKRSSACMKNMLRSYPQLSRMARGESATETPIVEGCFVVFALHCTAHSNCSDADQLSLLIES
eukprot:5746631-Amphidinium_carterae.1